MYRIYTSISGDAIKSDKRSYQFLLLLKLRVLASKCGGRFYLKDAMKALDLNERTTKKHLKEITEITKYSDGYHFTSLLHSLNKKNAFVLISPEVLNSFSWLNIASFRAYLTEISLTRYKRYQHAKVRGYKVFNLKDKSFEIIRDGKNSRFHNLVSIKCASLVTTKSTATISRYKKLQTVSKYSWKPTNVFDSFYSKNGEFNFKLFLKDNKGKFDSNGEWFSPISTRTTSLKIKVG